MNTYTIVIYTRYLDNKNNYIDSRQDIYEFDKKEYLIDLWGESRACVAFYKGKPQSISREYTLLLDGRKCDSEFLQSLEFQLLESEAAWLREMKHQEENRKQYYKNKAIIVENRYLKRNADSNLKQTPER